MKREQRYIVLKLKDVEAATQGKAAFMQFNEVCDAVSGYRATNGKPPLCCVVVEADWPEYERVWAMIEARVGKEITSPEEYLNAEARAQELEHLLGSGKLTATEQMKASVELEEVSQARTAWLTRGYGGKVDYVRDAGRHLQNICHEAATKLGWWKCPVTGEPSTPEYIRDTLFSKKINLIHSEISEAVEADRKSLKDTHLPHRDGVEVELADAAIRIFDLAGALGYDLGAAIAEKMEYNAKRADHKLDNRMKDGGKKY